MKSLDVPEEMKKLDPSNVLESIGMFPDQCADAWKNASTVVFPDSYKKAKNIVVCGMGGSRFTPRTIQELYKQDIAIPYEVIDGYDLPGYVGKDTLVILSSYSGTTEEVISCAKQAIEKQALLTGMAHGGNVIELLKTRGVPFYQFDAALNPCGQPRVGGGYLLMGHLAFLHSLGFLSIEEKEVVDAIDFAKQTGLTMNSDTLESQNPAKQLATILFDKQPILVVGEFMRGAINGFANQINETAKMISDFRYIPELNHHFLEGLTYPEAIKSKLLFVFFASHLYSQKIQKRMNITKDVVEKQHIQTHQIELRGPTKLAQVLESYTLGGFTTFYLAMRYDVDPVAIPWVDYFKAELGK